MRSHDQMWMLSEVAYLPSHSLAGGSPQEPHGENTKNNLGPRALPWDCDIGGVLWDKHAPPRRSVGASRFGVVQEWGSPDALPLPRFVLVRVEPLVFETLGPFEPCWPGVDAGGDGGPRLLRWPTNAGLCGHLCGHGPWQGVGGGRILLKTLVGAPRLELGTSCV